ncbi:hypothetical protein [Geopseudomonas aromaticivorans]
MTLAAIDALEQPTAAKVAARTGLSKGNIDTYVAVLNAELGTTIVKEEAVYRIDSWGDLLKQEGVRKTLTSSV